MSSRSIQTSSSNDFTPSNPDADELRSLKNTPKKSSTATTNYNSFDDYNNKTSRNNNNNDDDDDEEYSASHTHNIHHDQHLLRHQNRGGPIARLFDKFSLSPHFRRFVLIGTVIWFVLLTPAAWMPVERLACPVTTQEIPPIIKDSHQSLLQSSSSWAMRLAEQASHESSFDIQTNTNDHYDAFGHHFYSASQNHELSSSYMDNASNSLVFCKQSTDPDPLRWAAGVALLVSVVSLILSSIFSELAANNCCNYERHTELCGILPLVLLRTVMISGVITAYSIQLWFLISLKRPDCPETNHPCALYRLSEAAVTLGMISAIFIVFFMIGMVCLTFGVEKRLTAGLVKRILMVGLPSEEDDGRVTPGSPHFVAMHDEVFVEKCECDNCCCGKGGGCLHATASCLDKIRITYNTCYDVDDRCPAPLSSLDTVFCCAIDEERGDKPQPFKATMKNAFLQAFLGSFSPALGYFLMISTILLIESNTNGGSWSLIYPADGLFSCNNLFPSVAQLPTVVDGKDQVLYRLSSQSNAEALICTNMSDFDPRIRALPGILRTPNYVVSDNPRCSYHELHAGCKGDYCEQAFSAPPQPFGVFWSYVFTPEDAVASPCSFIVTPRTSVVNCTQSNVIRLSGYGDSLIGKSFLLPPFMLAIIMRFSAPLFAIIFLYIRIRWYLGKDNQEEFQKKYGKHKKHYLESFACDTLFANFVVAFIDPERFSELSDPPRYRMLMVSVQVCEFLIWIFRVEPCWRWHQVLFVCAQGYLLVKSVYNLYRDEIMIARGELKIESRRRRGETIQSETEDGF